jgi:hypothetical protein
MVTPLGRAPVWTLDAAALSALIDRLRIGGCRFVTIDALLSWRDGGGRGAIPCGDTRVAVGQRSARRGWR